MPFHQIIEVIAMRHRIMATILTMFMTGVVSLTFVLRSAIGWMV